MLSQSTNSRGKKAGGGVVVGSWRGGDLPFWAPPPSPPRCSSTAWCLDPRAGSVCVAGGWAGRRAAAGSPHPPHLPLMLIACGQPGVCLCVSALHLALSLSRSLQLNPFQTRGALSRHHDEAESEATGPAAGPSPPSHTPTPATLTLTHTQPLEPPHKQPEFDSGVGAWGSVCGGVDMALPVTEG